MDGWETLSEFFSSHGRQRYGKEIWEWILRIMIDLIDLCFSVYQIFSSWKMRVGSATFGKGRQGMDTQLFVFLLTWLIERDGMGWKETNEHIDRCLARWFAHT